MPRYLKQSVLAPFYDYLFVSGNNESFSGTLSLNAALVNWKSRLANAIWNVPI